MISDIISIGQISWSSTEVYDVYSSICMKMNNTVLVAFCIRPRQSAGSVICTIPQGFRPTDNTYAIMANAYNEDASPNNNIMNGYCKMNSSGEVTQNYGSSQFINGKARFSVLFIYNV